MSVVFSWPRRNSSRAGASPWESRLRPRFFYFCLLLMHSPISSEMTDIFISPFKWTTTIALYYDVHPWTWQLNWSLHFITLHYVTLYYIGQESIWPGIFPKGGRPEINHPVCTPNIVFLRSTASCGEYMKTRKEGIHI